MRRAYWRVCIYTAACVCLFVQVYKWVRSNNLQLLRQVCAHFAVCVFKVQLSIISIWATWPLYRVCTLLHATAAAVEQKLKTQSSCAKITGLAKTQEHTHAYAKRIFASTLTNEGKMSRRPTWWKYALIENVSRKKRCSSSFYLILNSHFQPSVAPCHNALHLNLHYATHLNCAACHRRNCAVTRTMPPLLFNTVLMRSPL